MKADVRRKNYYLDQKQISRAKSIFGVKMETEAIDFALDLVVFRKEILKSLERVAGIRWHGESLLVAKHLIDTDIYIDLIHSGKTLPIIRELYTREKPLESISVSVVAQDLLAGVRSPAGRRHIAIPDRQSYQSVWGANHRYKKIRRVKNQGRILKSH